MARVKVDINADDAIYQKLRREIHERMPVGFPESGNGSEIEILELLFRPEEAAVAVHLSVMPETAKKIHRRAAKAGIEISRDRLHEMLHSMYKRGLISGEGAYPDTRYSMAQLAIGIFEYQVDLLTKDAAVLAHRYMEGPFNDEFNRRDRPRQMRIIPVEKSIDNSRRVATYDSVRKIVDKKKGTIAVVNCVCKQARDLMDEPCRLSDIRQNCIMFDGAADFFIERGIPSAKKISRDELYGLLDEFQKTGFILQPANSRDPNFICACCGCCCESLRGLKMFPRPADYVASNYYAAVDENLCNGCTLCVKRCGMEAVTVNEKKASVDTGRCIGCGNCVTVCKKNALSLVEKTVTTKPPRDQMALYMKILFKKVGVPAMLRKFARMIAGGKM